jgi:hypothetical protein
MFTFVQIKKTEVYMKWIKFFVLFFVLFSCASENVPGCYREAGTTISREVEVAVFNKINIDEGVTLVVKQGNAIHVTIETGENIIDEVSAEVLDETLFVKNNLKCSLGLVKAAKVIVTVPDLKQIYSSSQFDVVSDGVLNFSQLSLQQGVYGKNASAVFDLEVHCDNLVVENNNTTIFRIKGTATNLNVSFYSGDSRFEGENLIAQDIWVFHRSSNDIILSPQNKIEGDIYSNGNVILKHTPILVNVVQHYTGHIVYN